MEGLAAVGALSAVLDAHPGALFVALRDGLRSDQPAWRIIAAVLSEHARIEAENTSARVASSIAYRRAHDRFTGGASVPFGYRSVPASEDPPGQVLVPDAAELAVVTRLLAGESPRCGPRRCC